MRRLGRQPTDSLSVSTIFFYVLFCRLPFLLSTEAHFVFPVSMLTARSSFQVQATHHLFPTVGKRTDCAGGRARARSSEGKRSYKLHSNCQHQSSSSCSASTSSCLIKTAGQASLVSVLVSCRPLPSPDSNLSLSIWRSFAGRTTV